MSSSDPQTEIRPGDELVAYLDGELPPEDCRRVEARLAADADYRQQLRDLDQAWEALDALPKPTVNDNFARTTIEMVSVVAERDLSHQKATTAADRRRRLWGWAAAGLAAALVGFAAAHSLLPDPNEKLLANLPVIHQLDVLSHIDDVEFLRRLPEALPIAHLSDEQANIEHELAAVKAAGAPSLEARRAWVEGLTSDQKAELEAQANRFDDLKNSPERERLRNLERQISQAADADELQKTLLVYGRWLTHRLPGDQEDLRMLATDKRLKLIREIVREEEERASRHLSDEDAAKLRKEIFEIYEDRKSAFERAMRRGDPDNRLWLEGRQSRKAWMVVLWELWNDDRDDKTTERLIEQLSSSQQAYWEKLPQRGRRNHRREQLMHWIREAMRPRWGPQELEKFFTEKLNSDQRGRLLTLPRDEMQSQLERLYFADYLGLRGPDELPSEFGLRSGFPPNRPGEDRPPRPFDRQRRDRDGEGNPPPDDKNR